MVIPEERKEIIDAAEAEVAEISGTVPVWSWLQQGERYNKVIDIWSSANEKVAKAMMANLSKEKCDQPRR